MDLSVARRRELLPALGRIAERASWEDRQALEELMLAAGFLTEEASNPAGAAWQGDSPDA